MTQMFQHYLTKNNCYIANVKIQPKGIMLHSTACPGVKAANFLRAWNTPKPNGNSVCVHGFLDDSGFYQTLPWTTKAWHAGGTANNSLIGFEICEPKNYADKEYFEDVKNKAVRLCVYLCKKFNLSAESITTHCEGYEKHGISYASNHADIHHWWKKYFNYTISDFRKEVAKKLKEGGYTMTFSSGIEALNYLAEKGRLSNPVYWTKVLETTNQIEFLYMKWAEDYAKSIGE